MSMMSLMEKPDYPIVSAGLDWVTAYNAEEFNVVMCGEFMEGLFDELKDRGHHIQKQVRLGYLGRATEGAFHGFYDGKSLAILSSDLAREFGVGLIKVSQKTSRLDLQVTVDAGAERPVLSLDAWAYVNLRPKQVGRPREYKLTRLHPQGDTFNVNKRTSESYARLYDWGAKNKMEEKHRFWRYEIEAKRGFCNHLASMLNHCDSDKAVATRVVFDWFRDRLYSPPFSPHPLSETSEQPRPPMRPGLLSWFDSSVSVSVGRAIKEFGLMPVLESLKLLPWVDVKPERREDHAST
jgi:hypothetical protein